jgi:hypothetical protein
MQTIKKISSLDITIVLTDKKDQQKNQSTIRLTNKRKLSILDKVDQVHNRMMQIASNANRKEKKQQFYNKCKSKN